MIILIPKPKSLPPERLIRYVPCLEKFPTIS
jgi:hypothetical protein